MSFVHLCPQFGNVVNTRECDYNGLDVLVVFEELLADRWVIIYRRRNGDLELLARYIFFDSWINEGYQPYASIVAVGVSLDKENNHLVIK
jgi:hypothetical protein